MAGEVDQVGNQVPVGEQAEEDASVVRDDGDVQPQRVIDRDERPDLEELGAPCIERKLRSGDIRGHDVHDRLRRPLQLRCHGTAGQPLQGGGRPVRDVRQRARGNRCARTLQVAGVGGDEMHPVLRQHGRKRYVDHHRADEVAELVTLAVVPHADGREDPQHFGHCFATLVKPARNRLTDDCEHRIVHRSAE